MRINQLVYFASLLFFRNWRKGGLSAIFLLMIMVVTLLSSISWYSEGIQTGINTKAAELFGGDLILKSPRPLPQLWQQQATKMNLATANVVYTNTIAASKTPDTQFANIQIKAVSPNYPLYGKIRSSDKADPKTIQSSNALPKPGSVWLEPRAAEQLHVHPGNTIEIGTKNYLFERYLYATPDGQSEQFKIAPTVLMSLEDLSQANILSPRSKADYLVLIAGQIEPYAAWVKPLLQNGQSAVSALDGRLELKTGFSQIMSYLKISIFLILLLTASVINVGLKEYNRKNDVSVGLLRCLGMTQPQVLILLVVQFLILIFLAGLIALPLGFAIHSVWHSFLESILPGVLSGDSGPVGWTSGVKSLLFCGLFLFVFGFQHWLGLSQVSPLHVLRRQPFKKEAFHWLFVFVKGVILFALLYAYLQDTRLLLFGLLFLCLIVIITKTLCFASGTFLRKIAHKLPVVLNIAALNIARYMPQSYIQIIVFTLISFAACFSYLLYDSLLNSWQKQIRPNTANYFIFNIAPENINPLKQFLTLHKLHMVHEYPILRGRLTMLNGVPLKKNESGEHIHNNALTRELNITASNQLPLDNQIISGTWWSSAKNQAYQASIEEGLAKNFGIKVGDKLSLHIAEQQLSVPVTSIRKVAWANQQPNFYIIVPQSLMEHIPISYLVGVRLLASQEADLDLLRQTFPSFSVLSIAMLIEQAKHFFQQLSILTAWIFLFVLFVGIVSQNMVLWTTRKERETETAMLKVFGITHSRLMGIWLCEYGFYAVFSSFIGIILAYLLQKTLLEMYLNVTPIVYASTIVIIILLNISIILISTFINVKKNMDHSPLCFITQN
ncbi:hypothetical protein J2N86_08490 [Legionella lytica]|uniref:ABC3 transporter permease C-terminal domain-containing protein n=1 Tax=Legionella lytica TaxID=96232 RepID=A0ABY4Y587_9GAMM|nr:FtsX-like permease family protein [Legionella lytica]USQ12745.1 hypothetical protein J2N86_08490 [Legionella lytica]